MNHNTRTRPAPAQEQTECPLQEHDAPEILEALDRIMHYHIAHSGDLVTAYIFEFQTAPNRVQVIVNSDPLLIAHLADEIAKFPNIEIIHTVNQPAAPDPAPKSPTNAD